MNYLAEDKRKALFREATIVITNACNSNCIMCPDAEGLRKSATIMSKEFALEQIENIPESIQFICITGGEPTLLKYELMDVLENCKEKFQNTDFLLLSNGRGFADYNFAKAFNQAVPNHICIGIAIHDNDAMKHDLVAQAIGSFEQTVQGIKNLISLKMSIEIRIVVTNLNYKRLLDISKFCVQNFRKMKRVNFMGLEMMGNAALNKEIIWVDFKACMDSLREASLYLIQEGIPVRLYNYPLCHVEKRLHMLCQKSISEQKIEYMKECEMCQLKKICGGFFCSTLKVMKCKAYPILKEEEHV